MSIVREWFDEIRTQLCTGDPDIREGKMMSSDAITYKGKVFAFFSPEQKMVFRLGKDYDIERAEMPIKAFNPFKNRPPLSGWFEVDGSGNDHLEHLAAQALDVLKEEIK